MVWGALRAVLCGGYEDYLRHAAADGDEKRLRRLLNRGVAPDPKQPGHASALQLAIQNGHLACVKALLDAGADVNRASDSNPLLDAAAHGHVDIVRLLLERKADPNATVNGNTALHMAARFGHQSVVEVLAPLVDLPKVLAAANAEGKTPLLLACSQQSGGEAAVKYLLAADADKLAADLAGNTALHQAALSGNAALAGLLLAGDKKGLNTPNCQGRTPLHLAAVFGRHEVVDTLMQQRPAVAGKDKDGSTVLHLVAKSVMCDKASQLSMAKAFIAAGADPAALDGAGHTAAYYSSSSELKQLLGTPAEAHPTAAGPISPLAAEEPVLVSSSNGAATSSAGGAAQEEQPANSKAAKLVNALASAMAAADSHEAAAGGSESWVVKEALRTHTSEEPEGWKLSTAVDHGSQH